MTERVDLVCPNPDCPALLIKGSPRFLCEVNTEKVTYLRIKCPICKTWWVWVHGRLAEVGTLVLEDVTLEFDKPMKL